MTKTKRIAFFKFKSLKTNKTNPKKVLKKKLKNLKEKLKESPKTLSASMSLMYVL